MAFFSEVWRWRASPLRIYFILLSVFWRWNECVWHLQLWKGHRLMNEGLTFIGVFCAEGGSRGRIYLVPCFFSSPSYKTEQVGGSHPCPTVNNFKVTVQIYRWSVYVIFWKWLYWRPRSDEMQVMLWDEMQ